MYEVVCSCVSTGAAERSYPHVRRQVLQLGGATPRPRSGAAAKRSNPTSKEQWLRGHRRAQRSYSMFKVRRGDSSKVRSSGCALLGQP